MLNLIGFVVVGNKMCVFSTKQTLVSTDALFSYDHEKCLQRFSLVC